MIITHFGKQFFKIQFGEVVLAFNPISKDAKGGAPTKFGSTVAFSTTNHPDYNGFENTSYGETEAFMVNGPGDYEVNDIFISGVASDVEFDGKKLINTIYSVTLEDMNICFLGAFGSDTLTAVQREAIGNPDIVFVPVNYLYLDPDKAYKLATSLEASIIIPTDYDEKSLKAFLKEAGEGVKPVDKLTLKKKDLTGKQGEVVVID